MSHFPSTRGARASAILAAAAIAACSSHKGAPSETTDGGSAAGESSGGGSSSSSSGGAGGSNGSSGADGSSGGPDGSSGGPVIGHGQSCDGGPCDAPPAGLLDPDYTTTWNPGILADTPTGAALGPDNLPVRTTTCATVAAQSGDATSAIQSALTGCAGKNQVVALAAGTYEVSATLTVPSGVVLRGAGSDVSTGTVIVSTQGGPVIAIGTERDQICYNGAFDSSAQPMLTADATKETSTISVASASGFKAGDLALVDQSDDGDVSEGDCGTYFKRSNRALSERVEIASVSGNTLTLSTPLHATFETAQSAQISRVSAAPTEWAGVESVALQGGRPGSYAGQSAGGVDVSNAAYCWVKDVQIDGTTSGMGIRLAGTYRCVVRGSHVHNSYSYGFSQDNYGIVLACGAADDLVEDDVVRFVNKPILMNNSGGGNVIGYNYADNSWSCDTNGDDGSQELNVDCHCAFPHMELLEGNWAPHMGASDTHGNAGYLTYFRNYASSQWAAPSSSTDDEIVWGQAFKPQYSNVGAIQLDDPDVDMTVIGNVLGSTSEASLGLPASLGTTGTGPQSPATSKVYAQSGGNLAIFLVDQTTVPWTSLWLDGNFDTVNGKVMWNASTLTANLAASTQHLPASLYYADKPAWWPAGDPWPWVGPDLSPMVGTLPAQQRSASFDYATSDDPSCTLDCADYCCSVGPSCSL